MLRTLACSCALLILTPQLVAAEWHLTPMVGFTFAGETTLPDVEKATDKVHTQFGGAVSLLGGGLLGLESIFVYTPSLFERDRSLVDKSRSLAWVGNLVLTAPRNWTEYGLRPYVSGGIGLMHVSVTDKLSLTPVQTSLTGFDIGGGAVGFLSSRTGIRFDFRYYSNLHRVDEGAVAVDRIHLRYFTGSVGIVFRR